MNSIVKASTFLCAFLFLTGAVIRADDQQIVIKSRSNLVEVPVVVTDKSGNHIVGLTKDDFEIKEDGKSQPVSSFEEIKGSLSRPGRLLPYRGTYTNEFSGETGPKRLTIFAIDLVNTPFMDQAYARQQLVKFLAARVDSQEPIALVAIGGNGIRILHDFTSDPALLVAALKHVSGETPVIQGLNASDAFLTEQDSLSSFVNGTEPYVMLAERQVITATLESFQHVAEAFAGVQGRKSLIWATAAFPFGLDPVTGTIQSPHIFNQGSLHIGANGMDATGGLPALPSRTDVHSSDELKTLEPLYQRTLQMLNDANISVYPVDARGLVVFFPGADTSRLQGVNAYNESLFEASRDTMVGFAEMTGGKAFYNRNDLAVAFQKAADDSSAYYMLGYYLDKNAKPGWRKLHVKVKRGGAEVRARNGFFVTDPKRADSRRMDLDLALASPLDYTGLPLSVKWTGAQTQGPKKKVHFQIMLPASSNIVDTGNNNFVNLEVVAFARTATGSPADQFSQHIEMNLKPESEQTFQRDGLNYGNDLFASPGEYMVRFVVRNNLDGRLGSVTAPLTVAP